jgi:hypothetical protein
MSQETRFLIFAIEYYRNKKGISGAEVASLFSKHGIYQLIEDNYFLYHIESPDNFVDEIDHYIATGELYNVIRS